MSPPNGPIPIEKVNDEQGEGHGLKRNVYCRYELNNVIILRIRFTKIEKMDLLNLTLSSTIVSVETP